MELPDFLTAQKYGDIRISGHRIDLFHIVYYFKERDSAADLQRRFPSLSMETIEKVLKFYREHEEEVDSYVNHCLEEMERQRAAAPKGPTVADLRKRIAKQRGYATTQDEWSDACWYIP